MKILNFSNGFGELFMMKCRKKILSLQIGLLLSSVSSVAFADSASCSSSGVTYTCSGEYSVYTNSNFNSHQNVVINNTGISTGYSPDVKGYGVYVSEQLSTNNLTVIMEGATMFGFQFDGSQTDAIRTQGGGTLTVTGQLIVKAIGVSADGINASITSQSTVNTGNNTIIEAASGTAVRANLSQLSGKNTINIGDGAQITTKGSGSNTSDALGYGIYAGSRDSGDSVLSNVGSAIVKVGANGNITTQGNNAYAVYANKTGYIQLGSGVDITTTNSGAHGIVAQDGAITTTGGATYSYTGGVVDLLGNTSINVNAATAKAIYASGNGSIVSSYNKDAAANTSGVFNVTGDMLVDNGGTIDLRMSDTSSFVGNTSIADATSTLNLDISGANSKWQMSQSSQVTDLKLANNANVILGDQSIAVDATNKVILTTENLSGNGLFLMRTNIIGSGTGANNIGDLLSVTGTSAGSHSVMVSDFYNGSAAVDGSERLKIIETADGGASFALKNAQYVDVGAYKYDLAAGDAAYAEDPRSWYLSARSGGGNLTNTADHSVSILSMNYLLSYVETQTLLNRIGGLHKGRDKEWDFWIRGFTGKMNAFNGSMSNFDLTYHGFQLGVDRRFVLDEAELYMGIVAGQTNSKANYEIGHGNADSYHFGLYTTYKMDNDFYIDALAKYTMTKNDFDTQTGAGYQVNGDTKTTGYAFGLEIGRRFYFAPAKSGFYLEPQAQLTYSRQEGATVHASNGLKTKLNNFDSLLGRASVITGYTVNQGDTPIDIYWKTGYLKEFKGKTNYSFNNNANTRAKYKFDGGWWENGVGVTAEINKTHNVYLEADYASGSKFDNKSLRVGYRFEF